MLPPVVALQGHLHSKSACTCTGLVLPLEEPSGGAKVCFQDQEIGFQAPEGRSLVFSVWKERLHIRISTAKRSSGSFYLTD